MQKGRAAIQLMLGRHMIFSPQSAPTFAVPAAAAAAAAMAVTTAAIVALILGTKTSPAVIS